MSKFIIYCYTFPNGKKYIGQTSTSIESRYNGGRGYKGQVVGDAIKKYGWKNVSKEILEEVFSKQEADELERELIIKFNTLTLNCCGYNVSNGGSGIGSHTEETKKIMSNNAKSNNPFKGKTHSEETKSKWNRKDSNNPNARRIKIINTEKNTEEIKDTLKEASVYMGMSYSTIRNYLSRGKNNYKNFLFFYEEGGSYE